MKSVLSLALLLVVAAPSLAAPASDYEVNFGPFVGSGSLSTGAKVQHVSGYALSVERHWQLAERVSLGPILEVSNALVNLRAKDGDETTLGTYDNRIFAAGFRLQTPVGNQGTLAQALYLSALAGRGFSKLAVDESTTSTFTQKLYGNIQGDYFAGEAGAWLPMKGSFGLNLAFLGSSYRVDQSESTGTFEGDEQRDGQIYLREGTVTKAERALPSSTVMRSYALKVGLSLGF